MLVLCSVVLIIAVPFIASQNVLAAYVTVVALIGAVANGVGLLSKSKASARRKMQIIVGLAFVVPCSAWLVYASVNPGVDGMGLGRAIVWAPIFAGLYELRRGIKMSKE